MTITGFVKRYVLHEEVMNISVQETDVRRNMYSIFYRKRGETLITTRPPGVIQSNAQTPDVLTNLAKWLDSVDAIKVTLVSDEAQHGRIIEAHFSKSV